MQTHLTKTGFSIPADEVKFPATLLKKLVKARLKRYIYGILQLLELSENERKS